MHPESAPLTPVPFFEVITGFQRSYALKTAIELDIFTAIGEGNTDAASIAESTGAAERGVRILCDCMAVMGFLTKADSEYSLSGVSAAFLDKRSPSFVGGAVDFLMGEAQVRGFEELTSAVRRGGSAIQGNASMDPDSEMWVRFARGMMPMMYPIAKLMAMHVGLPRDSELKVLDVAAGHGIFGITAANEYPNAQIYAADWPSVLTVAQENAEKFGVAERFHTIPGDAFETEFGNDFDVVLIPNFLHHFDAAQCTAFLKKCNAALKEDGRALTLEFVPNDDRVSPPNEAMFALIMLAATPAGDAYTFAELRRMLEDAGFPRNEMISFEPMPNHLIVSKKSD